MLTTSHPLPPEETHSPHPLVQGDGHAWGKTLYYDKSGEEHYNLISALHKSIRNSDADASLYWLVRMLEAGEDRRYLLRRLIRIGYSLHFAGSAANVTHSREPRYSVTRK